MSMQDHIRAALREQFETLDAFFSGLSAEQVSRPLVTGEWAIQDVVVHLWAWQQRSIARFEAALADRDPLYPDWSLDPDAGDETEQANAWIYATYREQPWAKTLADWRAGYLRFIEISGQVPEKDLLDSERYAWMEVSPLAASLLSSYDHHREHAELLHEWLGAGRQGR